MLLNFKIRFKVNIDCRNKTNLIHKTFVRMNMIKKQTVLKENKCFRLKVVLSGLPNLKNN